MKKYFLLAFFTTSLWAQNHLKIHVLPPLMALDWSTPRSLFKTAFKNRWDGGGRPFGHVYVDLVCDGKRLVTSTRSKDFNPISEFVWEGRGLGILYHTYAGDLESGERLEKELSRRLTEGRLLTMDYSVSYAHCKRMLKYFEEYKALNVARSYGLPHRPQFAEGGTDAAFAVSFLDVAGVINERDREEWLRSLNIPLAYSGPPLQDETVNFIKVLFGATEWGKVKDPHRKLQFYEPQKMYNWILRELQAKRLACTPETNKSVCLDATMLAVKHGSFWLQHTDPDYRRTTAPLPVPRPADR